MNVWLSYYVPENNKFIVRHVQMLDMIIIFWGALTGLTISLTETKFAIVGRSQQDVHYLGGAFVGHIAKQKWNRTYIRNFAMLSIPSLGADARVVKWISVISAVATVLADVPL